MRWWPLLILVVATAALTTAAYAVFDLRDHGAGVLAARPGPARAGASLTSPSGLGLAWRLQRGATLAWSVGLVLMGLAYGSLRNGVGDLIGDSQTARDLMTGSAGDLIDGFYGTAMLMLALMACGFAVSSALRPRTEEDDGRVEALLATGLPRARWLLGHVAVTIAGTALVVGAGGLGLGVGYALTTGDEGAVGRFTLDTLGYLPPVLVLAGLTRLLVGLVPRAASAGWLGLGWCVVVLLFGNLLGLPGWVQGTSPFDHLSLVPVEPFRWGPFVLLLLVAGLLSGAGQLAFARRDLR